MFLIKVQVQKIKVTLLNLFLILFNVYQTNNNIQNTMFVGYLFFCILFFKILDIFSWQITYVWSFLILFEVSRMKKSGNFQQIISFYPTKKILKINNDTHTHFHIIHYKVSYCLIFLCALSFQKLQLISEI